MPYKQTVFASQGVYHITNGGVEKRLTFVDEKDCQRFVETLEYYRSKNPPSRFSFRKRPAIKKAQDSSQLVEVISFCLMPNRFHLLVRQLEQGGVSIFLSKVTNSYTKYFNTRYQRMGPLFQGSFKAVKIEDGEQLISISRHIHLNPLMHNVVRDLKRFPYSSYLEFLGEREGFCQKDIILDHFKNPSAYEKFVLDQEDYGRSIKKMERQLLEE